MGSPKQQITQRDKCNTGISFSRRPTDKSIGVHMHLTVALLCLHLSFLMCCLLVLLLNDGMDWMDWVCPGLGLLLHWSLLATFSWMAVEGFHIYLLLIRVFNIYIRRYLLKVSLVGWGESSHCHTNTTEWPQNTTLRGAVSNNCRRRNCGIELLQFRFRSIFR